MSSGADQLQTQHVAANRAGCTTQTDRQGVNLVCTSLVQELAITSVPFSRASEKIQLVSFNLCMFNLARTDDERAGRACMPGSDRSD